MITKVTSENKGLYRSLFERANATLSLEGTNTIDSLDKYFSVLKDLTDEDITYGYLPLDEPTFDINADTRVITIPSDFKKNGISVKGDHYAEVLYFTINRYFDTNDLYDDNIKIVIQWEDPAGNKGVSLAVFKDVTVLAAQNKMLFGWALTESITHASGNVKFSVRFYELNASDELAFSLSTLTASAIVNPGLDYQFEDGEFVDGISVFADDAQNIRSRLRNSDYNAPDTIPAEATWVINLPANISEGVLAKVDLDAENTHTFYAVAESEQGVISYVWKFKPTGSADTIDITDRAGDVYVETSDIAYDGAKTYYHKVIVDSVPAYETFSFTPDDPIPSEGDTVYEKRNGLTISHVTDNATSVTGEYFVIAKNRIGLGSSEVESNHVIVPTPSALDIIEPAAAANSVRLEDGTEGVGGKILSAKANTAADGDTITYSWGTITEEGGEEIFTPISGATDTISKNVANTYAVPAVAANDRAKYDETFAVKIKANRNGDSTAEEMCKFRVTDPAHEPIVSLTKNGSYVNENTPATLKATVTNADAIAHDNFSYEWFLYNAADNADPQVFEIAGDTPIQAAVVAPESYNEILVRTGGNYYCKVKTLVNGSESAYWVPTQESQLLSLQNLS